MSKLDDLISKLREEERRIIGDVREREQRLLEAERRLEIHQAKLQGILEAKKLTEEASPPKALRQAKKRTRALSDHWKSILGHVYVLDAIGGGFDYNDLMTAAAAVGHSTGRDNLRSQMSLYKSAGLVESTEDGKFCLTAAGRRAIGLDNNSGVSPQNENEAPIGNADGASETREWSVTSTPSAPSNPSPWRRA